MIRYAIQRYSKGRRRYINFDQIFEDKDKANERKLELTLQYRGHFDGPMRFRVKKIEDD